MDDLKSETTAETEASADALEAAREAGLKWVTDTQPGIYRRKKGGGFIYLDAKGKHVHNEDQLYRARSLVIPPAWTDVWICASEFGHIQATGRDAKGRKQYRYHHKWRQVRDGTKYHRASYLRCGSNNEDRNANNYTAGHIDADHANTDLEAFAIEYRPDSRCYHTGVSYRVVPYWGRCGDRRR